MRDSDRNKLLKLGFSTDVIIKTEEVLAVWEIETLFVTCPRCGESCFNPDLPGNKFRRKKLPAELKWNENLAGYRDRFGEIVCWTCDEESFQ